MGFGELVIASGGQPGTSNIVFSAAVAPDEADALADEINSQSFREELRDGLLDPKLADSKPEQPFVEPVPVLEGKLTPPVSIRLDGVSDSPSAAEIQQAVEAALASVDPSLDPALVDVLAIETGTDGTVEIVIRVAAESSETTDELAEALATPEFLDALSSELEADAASLESPGGDTPAADGTQWSPLSTVKFGAPPEEVSEADFIDAVLQALQQAGVEGALGVDVLSLTDGSTTSGGADTGDNTDVVFSVLSSADELEGIAELIDSPEFRQMVLEQLFAGDDPSGADLPTVSAIPIEASTTPVQTIVIPGLGYDTAPTLEELEAALKAATSTDILPDIIGLVINDDGELVVAFQAVVPTGSGSDIDTLVAEFDSEDWLANLADQLGSGVDTVKSVDDDAPPGTEYVTAAITIDTSVSKSFPSIWFAYKIGARVDLEIRSLDSSSAKKRCSFYFLEHCSGSRPTNSTPRRSSRSWLSS